MCHQEWAVTLHGISTIYSNLILTRTHRLTSSISYYFFPFFLNFHPSIVFPVSLVSTDKCVDHDWLLFYDILFPDALFLCLLFTKECFFLSCFYLIRSNFHFFFFFFCELFIITVIIDIVHADVWIYHVVEITRNYPDPSTKKNKKIKMKQKVKIETYFLPLRR